MSRLVNSAVAKNKKFASSALEGRLLGNNENDDNRAYIAEISLATAWKGHRKEGKFDEGIKGNTE